jgi:hypothetical protein
MQKKKASKKLEKLNQGKEQLEKMQKEIDENEGTRKQFTLT